MSRIVFVTTRLPWPTTSGRKVSLYHYCRGLALRGHSVSLYVFPEWDQPRDGAGKPDFIEKVAFARPIGPFTKLKNLLMKSLFCGAPFQCALYDSGKNRRALLSFVKEAGADTVIFDMIRTAPYLRALKKRGCRCILDLDDLLSVRYERQLAAGVGDVSIAGRYAGGIPPALDRLLCRGWIGRRILKSEQRRLKRAEIKYATAADGVILVSEREAAAFNERLGAEKTVALPIGIDPAALAPVGPRAEEPALVGFVGNLHVAANLASLDLIVREILPGLQTSVRLEVIGPYPPEVAKRYEKIPDLTLLGAVPAIPPVAHRWCVALSPVAFGSGIKTKVLEAMAMHLPVLTNSTGLEGIPARSGEHLLVADTPAGLTAALEQLLADPALRKKLGEAGAAFVADRFDWQKIFQEFASVGL